MMNLTEIRRILDGAREGTICNYDEGDTATHAVCLSLDQIESINASLFELQIVLAALPMGAC